ncbi:4E-binding protein [Heterostelium album PN500]|uniref:4E-binding protein n=1 Tax=Heterostelium pallidum (strain ATCC 26659 / Pp 5 / PN500) TaxID=670386 RepID=D3AVT4_HETP5|nr:4E-binding protein [Heterostelium album PN500]EFA86407.1 4E-binding protein [Heterostelium album PN500]|eukprot:XP_020438512.1 4E-binding protein [Heterostelium album PN500]
MSSASPSTTSTRAIPFPAKDPRHDLMNFSTSLGGSIYGTTPGGTKIKYDRSTLLQIRNSPLSKTPPPELAGIIEVLNKPQHAHQQQQQPKSPQVKSQKPPTAPVQPPQQQPESTAQKTASTAKTNEEAGKI